MDGSILTTGYLKELGEHLDDIDDYQRQDGTLIEPGKLWLRTRRDTFIEHFLKIRTKWSNRALFQLNQPQRELSYLWRSQNIVLKARQLGITTYVAARFFTQTITQPGILSMQVTQDRESSEDIFRIVHRFWDNLPEHLKKGQLRTSHQNARQLVFPEIDGEYCLASASDNAGRGRTIQNLHCSEVSRWGREGDEALASLRAAVVPTGDIVLESTPNGAGGVFYEEWQRAEETGYRRHFYPWWYDPSYAMEPDGAFAPLTEAETELMVKEKLSIEQIAWRRKQWSAFRGKAKQEYAEDAVTCFLTSGECAFDIASVEQRLLGTSEPYQLRDNGNLMVWFPPKPRKEYVIGVDPAGGGTDGDYSCAQVIERSSGMQCAELHGHWNPVELAHRVAALGREYNTALMAVERNNHGHAVLAHLRMMRYPRIFADQDKNDGWLTTVASKPPMIENLVAMLAEKPEAFRSERLLNECRTFVRNRAGQSGATGGAHDDCVIAFGIALAVRASEAGKGAKQEIELSVLK